MTADTWVGRVVDRLPEVIGNRLDALYAGRPLPPLPANWDAAPETAATRLHAALVASGPALPATLARATGLPGGTVRRVLKTRPDLFSRRADGAWEARP